MPFHEAEKRWGEERTFSRFGWNRRLAGDFENLAAIPLAFVASAALRFGIGRLTR